MTSPDEARRLFAWALGSFHATLFLLVAVLILYSRGILGPLLASLNTLAGLGLFLALWATTFYTTSRALRGVDLGAPWRRDSRFLLRALRWGAVNGMLFLVVLGVGAITVIFWTTPFSSAGGSLPFIVFAAPIALVVSAAVGAAVGTVLGVIDLALMAVGHAALGVDQGQLERSKSSGTM